MTREPARKIPEGLLKARAWVNELELEGLFKLNKQSDFWSRAEVICAPLIPILSISKENFELEFDIVIGIFEDSESIENVMSELPIPISHEITLEANPLLTIKFQFAATPQCKKNEISNFITDSLFKSLLVVQTALVMEAFTPLTRDAYSQKLPKPGQIWSHGELVRNMLGNA